MALLLLCVPFLQSCGYTFQSATNPLAKVGIKRIFVKNFRNDSYRPGIEHYFSNALAREIKRFGTFRLVSSPDQADAIFSGVVRQVDSAPAGDTTVGRRKISVATNLYSAVTVDTVLIDKDGQKIFGHTVTNSKIHTAAPFGDETGQTAHLINESEQRLAYRDISVEMMAEVYQRLVDVF